MTESEHINLVKSLLEQPGSVDEPLLENGRTALMIGAEYGHTDLVEKLLDRGADIDKADLYGGTALMLAAEEGHVEAVTLLLAKGASVDSWTALMLAAECGHTELVEKLLVKDISVDKANSKGWTPLMLAAECGHIDVVKLLLSKGADIGKGPSDGWTALMGAAGNGHTEVVALLLSKNANVNQTMLSGDTALIFAAQGGHIDVVELLLSKGVEIDKGPSDGWTALMGAAKNGHTKVAKLLLDKGAKVDGANSDGRTALMTAAYSGHTKVVELLLNKGAKIDKATSGSFTALMIAAYGGHAEIVELLLYKDAKTELRDNNNNKTALEIAFLHKQYSVIKQFLIAGAFTPDNINEIKNAQDNILSTADEAEQITIIANIIRIAAGVDQQFVQASLRQLDDTVSKICSSMDTKSFRINEKIKQSEKAQSLKPKIKATSLTKNILDKLRDKVDDEFISKLQASYDKISEVWGRCISKGKITKDPTKEIASYFTTDDDLEAVCKAVPYEYAIQMLKQPCSQESAGEINKADKLSADSHDEVHQDVLGAEAQSQ